MSTSNEQLSKFSLNGLESALRFAQISLEGTERLVRLNLDASKQTLEQHAKAVKELAQASNPQEAFNQLNQLAGQSLTKALAHSHSTYEIFTRTQSELSKLAEENLGAFNKSVNQVIDTIAKEAASVSKKMESPSA